MPPARTCAAQAAISSGRIISAPQAPRPPALATAMESSGGQAPAMGASRIGSLRPNRSQNAWVRACQDIAQRPPIARTAAHSSGVTGCTDRREFFTSTMSFSRPSALIAARLTGRFKGSTA